MNLEKIDDFVRTTINEFYGEMQNDPDVYLEEMQEKIKKMENRPAAIIAWWLLENTMTYHIWRKNDNIQK